MSTSTRTTESRYPSRSRVAPECSLVDANQPVGAPARHVTNDGRTLNARQQQQQPPRRIPALTTSRIFGEKSPIANADIQAFLAKCMSTTHWQSYNEKEKAMIVDSLPATRKSQGEVLTSDSSCNETLNNHNMTTNGDEETTSRGRQAQNVQLSATSPLTRAFCSNDPYLKRSVARFKRELTDGYYTKIWQDKAKRAHEERIEGKFDEYLLKHAAEMFVEEEEEEEEEEGDEAATEEVAEESEDGDFQDGGGGTGKNGKARRGR